MGISERKDREKQQRREEIVQAAEKVFFSNGFERSTMDDIAEQAELSKGTLYLYFKSKEDLHMAVARKAIVLLNTITNAVLEVKGNALEKLIHMGRACIRFSDTHPDHMKAIMTLEGFELQSISYSLEEIQELIYKESPVGMVMLIVEQGVKEKLIRADIAPHLIAHTLWMQVLSVIRFVTMKKSLFEMLDLSPAQVYESHFELVLNGIRS
ncbi:MAG: TetR/AcrR family transcriptional regulator [Bacteroidales bacterium]|nr:TetR/AcrR family transcriptional regulator [Bacteroidales bacterium]